MFFPNSNSENVFVFDSYTKFADAVAAFKRGANVFYQSGTTYDMLTSYEGGALKGSKYTVDENGASETGGGGGGQSPFTYVRFTYSESGATCDKTFEELSALLEAGSPVMAYDQYGPLLLSFNNGEHISQIYATGLYCQINGTAISTLNASSYVYSADGITVVDGSMPFTD